jgi:hypothetical protein
MTDSAWVRGGRHLVRLALLVFPLAMAAGSAQAASKDGRDNKERQAKTACLSGDYKKGVALLAELYVSTNDPNYLFNQGRCFEQNGKYEEAIVRFREYQRKNKDAGHPVDPDADKHIADCQALLGKPALTTPVPVPAPANATTTPTPAAATVAPAAAVPVTATAVAPPPGASPPPAEPTATTGTTSEAQTSAATNTPTDLAASTQAPDARGLGLRVGGIVAVVAGVAGVATGVVLNLKSNSLAKDLERSNTSYSRAKESDRSRYETWSWVGYGVGGACIVGGAILYYLGFRQGHEPQVALVPSAGPGHVGALLQGAF